MNTDSLKSHLRDLVKAIIATAIMAAIQAVVQYLAHVDWPAFLHYGTQAAVAFGAVKFRV